MTSGEKERTKATFKKRKKKEDFAPSKPLVRHDTGSKWYEYASDERLKADSENKIVEEMEQKADFLFRRDVDLFNQFLRATGGSETSWLGTIVTKGTASDRTTAMQLFVQKSPVHSLSHISSLVAVVEKKNTREAYAVLGILKELFINELLPPNRKLIPFSKRPISDLKQLSAGSQQNMERRLILWKFESDLKNIYENFVKAVERLAGGNIENVCAQACRVALDLLAERPELEQKLLSLLVNKLGHPNYKVASKVCGYLLQLSQRQPNMRPVIVSEVERLIYRRNIACRAQLYAVTFLSQLQLRAGETELAAHLLNIYFGFFRMLIAKGKMDDKILSILLSGTNRAFPYAKDQADKIMKEIDTLYKVLHQSNFATALQTLKLLYQLLTTSEGVSDRYYSALYRKLLDVPHSSSHESQLFDLIYRTLTTDSVDHRVIAFIKRLLQLALNRSAAFAAASLIVVAKIAEERPSILILSKTADRLVDPSILKVETLTLEDDDEEEKYFDVPESDEVQNEKIKSETPEMKPEKEQKASSFGWVHKNNIVFRKNSPIYDPSVRNPLFARAELSVATELLLLREHYHPSVAVFASNLLTGTVVRYDGNPLLDFTPMRFLDRFVYRNPKTKADKNANAKAIRRKAYDPHGVKKLPVSSKEYISKSRQEIPVDERYLHRFVTSKWKVKKEKKEEREDEEIDFSDIESVNSEEFEMLLDRFEPGEKNDVFDVDFAKEFSVEKKKKDKKGTKRGAEEDINDDDDGDDLEEDMDDDEELEEDELEDEEEDAEDEEEEYDGILEGEESEDEDGPSSFRQRVGNMDDDESDDDFAERLGFTEDAARSADKVAEMMEDEAEESKRRKSKKKISKPRGFKKRRVR